MQCSSKGRKLVGKPTCATDVQHIGRLCLEQVAETLLKPEAWGYDGSSLAAYSASSSVCNGSPDLNFIHDGQERGVQVAQQRQSLQQAGHRLSAGLASAVAEEQGFHQDMGHHSFPGSKPT